MPKKTDTRIILKLTDGTIVKGKTNRKTYNRLSDFLNSEENPYLVLYDAFMSGKEKKAVFINKQQIVWLEPEE
jgi:hypothetical protein